MTKFVSLVAISMMLFSCVGKESSEEKVLESTNLGVDMPSELTVLMHTMEANMQRIKRDIKERKKMIAHISAIIRIFSALPHPHT